MSYFEGANEGVEYEVPYFNVEGAGEVVPVKLGGVVEEEVAAEQETRQD